jgi:hypothetical protein
MTNTTRRLNGLTKEVVCKALLEGLDAVGGEHDPASYLEQRLFFLSAHLPRSQNIMDEFAKLHFELCRTMFKKNLVRKRDLQPRGFAFVDFEGTRSKSIEGAWSQKGQHVHALLLVDPSVRGLFLEAFEEATATRSATALDVRRYLAEKSDIEHLVSYCMKGYSQTPGFRSNREDLWDYFPRPRTANAAKSQVTAAAVATR